MSHDNPVVPSEGASYSPEDGELVHDDELLSSQVDSGPPPEPMSLRSRRTVRLGSRVGEILVGRYQVERSISRTPREIVLLARHLELGQRVVLRHLTLEATASLEAVQRFQRGARRAREMRSEHAERIVDFGRLESGAPYRASELPLGPSLAEVLRVRGALPVTEVVDLVVAACEPVAEAHASGVIHRVLCTSAIYVERRPDGSPLVRVLDFGVTDPLEPDPASQEATTITSAATMTASLPYASPEQIRSPGFVDARSDVWAFGAILYELLAGAPLFQADNPLSLLAMIAADAPTPLGIVRGDVPAELEALILSCLEKDPDARPRSVVDLALALAPFGTQDADVASARVARIVNRTTRPPALPSSAPRPPSSMRPSMLMRTRQPRTPPPPPPQSVTVAESKAHGITMLAVGAALGVGAAVVTALVTRPAATPVVVSAPEPAQKIAVPVAAPVALTPAPVPVASVAPAAAPTPLAPPAPVAPRVRQVADEQPAAPRPAAPPTRPAIAQRTASSPRSAAAAEARSSEQKPTVTATADAKDLFSGLE